MIDMFAQVGIVSGAVVALSTAVFMSVRKVNELGKWLHEINVVVNRELTENHGSSMKDQLETVDAKLDVAKGDLAYLQSTVDSHIGDQMAHASDPTAHRRPTTPDDGAAGPR